MWTAVFGAAAVALAAGALFAMRQDRQSEAPADESSAIAFADLGRDLETATLVNAEGERVEWSGLNGQPRAVFFGFTHCPVICPVTIYELTDAVQKLGPQGAALTIDFISVDPDRDTPQVLHDYVTPFGPNIRAFTGAREEIDRVAEAFEVTVRKVDLETGDYTIDHTASVFLVDRNGAVVDAVAYGTPPETLAERLRAIIKS